MRLWQLAHAGFARCCASRSRNVAGVAAAFVSSSFGTLGGGGGGGVPSIASSSHLPRSTGLVRCGCEETASTADIPSRPPRWLPSGNSIRCGCSWLFGRAGFTFVLYSTFCSFLVAIVHLESIRSSSERSLARISRKNRTG